MLSFYNYLRKFVNNNSTNVEYLFHKIDFIDAAMLSESEYIIDVILAKMWEKFRTLISKPDYQNGRTYERLLSDVEEDFVEVRSAYLTMKYKQSSSAKDIAKEKEIPTASGLQELATGINLKESMKKLVENYIKVFNSQENFCNLKKAYLVLAIDDVDMANAKAWNILEQLRMYMSIPNVIILLTADMERLREVCEASFVNKNMSDESVTELVNNYLEKVMPINNRIRMPELIDGNTEVLIDGEKSILSESQLERDIILENIVNKYDIYFSRIGNTRHFLQNDSLRSLVNYFAKKSCTDKMQIEKEDWLKKDLKDRLIEKVVDKKDKAFLRSLCNMDYLEINNRIVNYISKVKKPAGVPSISESSLGQVLYLCGLLEESDVSKENDTETGTGDVTEGGTESAEQQQVITDANGGDITSSVAGGENEGSTAPLTGVLLDSETGEALNTGVDDDSPY